jgi:hypothetical protein
MSKSVRFSETPDLVRQLSDRGTERIINTQTSNEKRLAMNSYYNEETEKINKQQEEKRKRKEIPISTRVESAVTKGAKESSHIRSENIAQKYRYDNWWLGGNKQRKTRSKRKCGRKRTKRTKKK